MTYTPKVARIVAMSPPDPLWSTLGLRVGEVHTLDPVALGLCDRQTGLRCRMTVVGFDHATGTITVVYVPPRRYYRHRHRRMAGK